jgi:hypothetical protein
VGDLTGRPVLVAVGGYGTAGALLLLPLSAGMSAVLPPPPRANTTSSGSRRADSSRPLVRS